MKKHGGEPPEAGSSSIFFLLFYFTLPQNGQNFKSCPAADSAVSWARR
nr:hypothetical protein [uncultured Oscillibacter sp.]